MCVCLTLFPTYSPIGDSSLSDNAHETTDDRQPCSPTTPRTLRGGDWTGMLDGTSRPTNPEYEPDDIHIAGRGSRLTGRDEPDPVTSRLA